MAEDKYMTQDEEREHYLSHQNEKRPNKFAKDGVKLHHTDYYSRWKSAMSQLDYQIEELKRKAREEEAKKRANKKKKGTVDVREN